MPRMNHQQQGTKHQVRPVPPPRTPIFTRTSTILAVVCIAISVGLHQRITTPHDPTAPSSLAVEATALLPGVKVLTLPIADGLHSTVLYRPGKDVSLDEASLSV